MPQLVKRRELVTNLKELFTCNAQLRNRHQVLPSWCLPGPVISRLVDYNNKPRTHRRYLLLAKRACPASTFAKGYNLQYVLCLANYCIATGPSLPRELSVNIFHHLLSVVFCSLASHSSLCLGQLQNLRMTLTL